MLGPLANAVLLEIIPNVPLPKPVWVLLNWGIIVMFVIMNLYITYEVSKVYGAALSGLFTGQE